MYHYLQSKESGHGNTHTQLSSRGWVAAVSKVTTTMAMVALVLSPLALTSCSSVTEPDATLAVAPPNGHDNDQNGKSRHTITDWTDAGVLHNTICRIADDSLALNWHNRYTTEAEYLEWLFDECLSEYVTLNLSISSGDEASARANYWQIDSEDLVLTTPEVESQLSGLVYDDLISQRESDFMKRHHNIVNLCYGTTLWTTIQDSMDTWKDDILGLSLAEDEVTIIPFMSVAYQSFTFWLEEGYDETDPNYDGPIILRNDANAAEIDAAAIRYAMEHFGWTMEENYDQIMNFSAYCSVYRGWFESGLGAVFN